jgi:hypothetical protein
MFGMVTAWIVEEVLDEVWSRRGESNPWPFDYESNALPLSYSG